MNTKGISEQEVWMYWDYSLTMIQRVYFFFIRSSVTYQNGGLISGVDQTTLWWSLRPLTSLCYALAHRARCIRLFDHGVDIDFREHMVPSWVLMILDLGLTVFGVRYRMGWNPTPTPIFIYPEFGFLMWREKRRLKTF